jgi:hypothetical protein
VDVVVYAGVVCEHHGHGAASTFSLAEPPSLPTRTPASSDPKPNPPTMNGGRLPTLHSQS